MHEATKTTDLYQIFRDEITNPKLYRKKKADRERDEKIKHFTPMVKSGLISVAEFLEIMSGKDILPPVGV